MDRELMAERKRKADIIVNLYKDRENRQEDVARRLNIPIKIVQAVTKAYGFEHTKLKTSDNLYAGQMREMVVSFEELGFLDKYNF